MAKLDKKTEAKKPKSNHIKPAHSFIYKLSEAVLIYAGLDFLLRADNQIVVGVVAFALLWITTDVALWFYNNFVKPSAKAIAKNNK